MAGYKHARVALFTNVAAVRDTILDLDRRGRPAIAIANLTGISLSAVHTVIREAKEEAFEVEPAGEKPPAPLDRSRPRRLDAGPDESPTEHSHPELPGFAAWQAVHHRRMDVRAAARLLGLRYPSQVFDLLAQHKVALEAKLAAAAKSTKEGRA